MARPSVEPSGVIANLDGARFLTDRGEQVSRRETCKGVSGERSVSPTPFWTRSVSAQSGQESMARTLIG